MFSSNIWSAIKDFDANLTTSKHLKIQQDEKQLKGILIILKETFHYNPKKINFR